MPPKGTKAVIAKAKAPAKGKAKGKEVDEPGLFNEKDLKFLTSILANLNDRAESVDWQTVVTNYGSANAKQAKEKFRTLAIKQNWYKNEKFTTGATVALTDGDIRFIKAMFDGMRAKPDADWGKVQTAYGYTKDKKQTLEKWRVMAIKFGWARKATGDDATGPSGGPRPKAATSTATAGKKRAHEDEEEEESLIVPSPRKRIQNDSPKKATNASSKKKAAIWDHDFKKDGAFFPGLKKDAIEEEENAEAANAQLERETEEATGTNKEVTKSRATRNSRKANGKKSVTEADEDEAGGAAVVSAGPSKKAGKKVTIAEDVTDDNEKDGA